VERVHWDDDFAREIGVPAAFDYGLQRVAWAINLMTNWMGDDGFIKKQHTYLREVNLVGDTLWYIGKVTRKFEENNEHLVDCEFLANDQRGRTVVAGQSIIKLPSRG
jgi:hypothetical protein